LITTRTLTARPTTIRTAHPEPTTTITMGLLTTLMGLPTPTLVTTALPTFRILMGRPTRTEKPMLLLITTTLTAPPTTTPTTIPTTIPMGRLTGTLSRTALLIIMTPTAPPITTTPTALPMTVPMGRLTGTPSRTVHPI